MSIEVIEYVENFFDIFFWSTKRHSSCQPKDIVRQHEDIVRQPKDIISVFSSLILYISILK